MNQRRINRRQLLQVGALGMMLDLPELLRAGAAGESTLSRRPSDKSCIFIFQQGGPSQLDTWDLKPDAPDGTRGPYRPIATRSPGMQICDLMPRLATLSEHYCLIRSMTTPTPDHALAQHTFLSGHAKPQPNSPYFGAILARLSPAARIPSYVWLQSLQPDAGVQYQTGGFLGPIYGPLQVGTTLDNPSTPNFRIKVFDPADGVSPQQIQERRQLLTTIDAVGHPMGQAPPAAGLQRLQERAFDLVTGDKARHAFALEQEPTKLRQRYGLHPLGQNLLMARRLIEAGVRLVSVNAFTGFDSYTQYAPVVNVWDMHGAGGPPTSIFGKNTYGLPWVLPRFDEAVSALLEDLAQRGLLQNTLVVAAGEFGRTPKIDASGVGRDHWSGCFSAMLAGASIRGGMVYGASDKIGAYVKDKPVTPDDFGATVLHALGVPPETRLSRDGFTSPASTGRPILDLFA